MQTRIHPMRRTWRIRRIWGFDGYAMLSLKSFSVSRIQLLKVLYLLVSYPLSYTWLKREPQISIRKERFIRRYLQYGVLGDCVF